MLTELDDAPLASAADEVDISQLAAKLEQQIRTLASRFRSTKPKSGFSPSEWLVLITLHGNPGIELKDLAGIVRISFGATAKITRTLFALRLIEWKKDRTKRRQYVLSVTQYGRQTLTEGRSSAAIQPLDWFRGLSTAELATITTLLDKCAAPSENEPA